MLDKAGGRYLHKKTDGDGYGALQGKEKDGINMQRPGFRSSASAPQPSPAQPARYQPRLDVLVNVCPLTRTAPGCESRVQCEDAKGKTVNWRVGGVCEGGNDAHRQSRFCGQTCGDSKTCSARYWTPALSRSTKVFLVHHGFPGPKKKIFFFPSLIFPLPLLAQQCWHETISFGQLQQLRDYLFKYDNERRALAGTTAVHARRGGKIWRLQGQQRKFDGFWMPGDLDPGSAWVWALFRREEGLSEKAGTGVLTSLQPVVPPVSRAPWYRYRTRRSGGLSPNDARYT